MSLETLGANLLRYTIDNKENPKKFICLDTETTNLNLFAALPWQISFLYCEGKDIKESFNLYPYFEQIPATISKDAARICNFSAAQYRELGQNPKEVLEIIHRYLFNDSIFLVGQNILCYDLYVLRNFYRECGQLDRFNYSLINKIYDTLLLGKAYKSGHKFHSSRADFVCDMYKLSDLRIKGSKLGLANLMKELGVEVPGGDKFHDADFDVRGTWGVFLKFLWLLEID